MNILEAREAAMAGKTVIGPNDVEFSRDEFAADTPGDWSNEMVFGEWKIKEGPVVFEANVESVSAANPQAILEILDRLERYREALSTIETFSSYSNRIVHIDTARKELHKIKWLAREALEGGK